MIHNYGSQIEKTAENNYSINKEYMHGPVLQELASTRISF